jgi:hypothetical protein
MNIASTVVMVRPASFGYNAQTAVNNAFQQYDDDWSVEAVQEKAVAEFDHAVKELQQAGIEVLVYDDLPFPHKPDAVFPNNWFCTLPDGTIAVFPLFAPNRSEEKRNDILEDLSLRYNVSDVEDWSEYEAEGFFLESTGSMVFDFKSNLIYACVSPRTHRAVLEKFASAHQFKAMLFNAADKDGMPIYHTNVVMAIADEYAIICDEVIRDENEAIGVKHLLSSTGHELISISEEQMKNFAGNTLQLQNSNGKKFLVLSQNAFDTLSVEQRDTIKKYNSLLPINVPTIETVGGGGIRCMMADIHLPQKLNEQQQI